MSYPTTTEGWRAKYVDSGLLSEATFDRLTRGICGHCHTDVGGYSNKTIAQLAVEAHAAKSGCDKPVPLPKRKTPSKQRKRWYKSTCPCGYTREGGMKKKVAQSMAEHLVREDHIHHAMDVKEERII